MTISYILKKDRKDKHIHHELESNNNSKEFAGNTPTPYLISDRFKLYGVNVPLTGTKVKVNKHYFACTITTYK